MLIKYNNDNNPFFVVTVTPKMMVQGLTTIGGYMALFGIIKILLFMYNQHSFEKKLLKKYRGRV